MPRRAGPGSAKDRWLAYAAANEVEVDPEASREEIIAALEAYGIPTE